MVKIGIYEAKKHFSHFIHRVQSGEEFIITNRGRAVAQITAPVDMRKIQATKLYSELRALIKTAPLAVSVDDLSRMKNEGRR